MADRTTRSPDGKSSMVTLVGIVNCTPDSFSDGSGEISHVELVRKAKRLRDEGANMLDVGGDSTRPGSRCCGIDEEWRRIAPVLRVMSREIPCSVDTHFPEVARRAILEGATFINDISGRFNDEMVETIAASAAHYIFMFNAHGGAHTFGDGLSNTEGFSLISNWISDHTIKLIARGIAPEKLIADPGMGAFISGDPMVSYSVIKRFHELPRPGGGLLLGCSRKGFLGRATDRDPSDRDQRSAIAGAYAAALLEPTTPLYLRVHNVAEQRRALERWPGMEERERGSWLS